MFNKNVSTIGNPPPPKKKGTSGNAKFNNMVKKDLNHLFAKYLPLYAKHKFVRILSRLDSPAVEIFSVNGTMWHKHIETSTVSGGAGEGTPFHEAPPELSLLVSALS